MNNHLEKVEMPDGLVAVGDAACSFNPIYGQGMTVAIQGADLLAHSIGARLHAGQGPLSAAGRQESLKGLSREFQTKLAATVDFPWKIATGDDIKYLRTTGLLPPERVSVGATIMNWYMERAVRSAMEFWRSNLRLVQVMHMMAPTSTLFHPDISLRVLQLVVRDLLTRGIDNRQPEVETARPTTKPKQALS
eukprot:jgi/Botrbrau1/5517/Bobra.0023s0005.1